MIEDDGTRCPRCGSTKLIDGPEGGGGQDFLCGECGTEYCFGLDWQPLPRDESRARIYGLRKLPSLKPDGSLLVYNTKDMKGIL